MIRTLNTPDELASAQHAMRQEVYGSASIMTRQVGFPGGSHLLDIAWHPSSHVWGYVDPDRATPLARDGQDCTHFWNAFGLQDPTSSDGLSISFEANPPFEGPNRRMSGAIGIADDSGQLLLLHRGRITVRSGVPRATFWREFDGRTEAVEDAGKIDRFAVVGVLGAGTLISDLRAFADEMTRIKDIIRQRL